MAMLPHACIPMLPVASDAKVGLVETRLAIIPGAGNSICVQD